MATDIGDERKRKMKRAKKLAEAALKYNADRQKRIVAKKLVSRAK